MGTRLWAWFYSSFCWSVQDMLAAWSSLRTQGATEVLPGETEQSLPKAEVQTCSDWNCLVPQRMQSGLKCYSVCLNALNRGGKTLCVYPLFGYSSVQVVFCCTFWKNASFQANGQEYRLVVCGSDLFRYVWFSMLYLWSYSSLATWFFI